MKLKNLYFFIFLISGCVIAQEGAVEVSSGEETSISEARSMQRDAQERIDQAQKEQEEAKTDQEKKEAELREQRAQDDLYMAKIQEQKGLLELANQQNDSAAAQQAQQQIIEAENNQKVAQGKIQELLQQLTQEFVPEKITDITSDSQLLDYAEQLPAGASSDDENIEKKFDYITKIQAGIKDIFDDATINDQLSAQKNVEAKLSLLDNKRMSLSDLLDIFQSELKGLTAASTLHELSDAAQKYKQSLEEAISYITQRKVTLDVNRVSLEVQNVSLFSRVISTIKDWFDSTFEFYKKPWYKRSVDDEITKLSDIKQQVSKLLSSEGIIESFSDQVSDLSGEVETLENQFKEYQANKMSLNFDQFQDSITNLQKRINNVNTQGPRDVVNEYNTLYSESLQPMVGDVSAKSRRYKDPKFATLFDQMADYYTSDSIFGKTSYKPEQAYQALFTPEVIDKLNAENPELHLTRAMFDPLTFNPDNISPELIDQAYAASRKLYTQGPVFLGARNASFLLRNPVDRATYDAFLKDYKNLLSRGIKDPYKGRSPQETMFLNNQGALSKLQITAVTNEQIKSVFGDIITTIGETKSEFDGMAAILSNADAVKEKIQTLQQNISSFKQAQEQGILNIN